MSANIIPTAEPFFFPGGEVGCLLVHGFTGTPKEMGGMGDYLNAQGYTVLGVRLAGHATSMENMRRTRWRDWVNAVHDGYCLINGSSREVILAGLSMGGCLSLLTASQLPCSGVIAMSTPYALPADPRLPFLKWLHWLMPATPKGEPDWHDPGLEEDHISYPAYPTRSIHELKQLLAEMRAALPAITVPTLLIHSRQDRGVDPGSMLQIHAQLGSEDKEMVWVKNSGHVITRDKAKEQVFQAAEAFIQRVTKNGA